MTIGVTSTILFWPDEIRIGACESHMTRVNMCMGMYMSMYMYNHAILM